ncbi:MAG: hypothetical protein Udaeo2_18530 [Candidatus Udaeobacter sp.]|nr:MAG: hypothetical protein Udaeo2_18530 [Candidatus Udaeobacter sp.]
MYSRFKPILLKRLRLNCGQIIAKRKSADGTKPTENGEAYLAFVQAHNLQNAVEDFGKLKQSEQLYARAVELDPKFALLLRATRSWKVGSSHIYEPTRERRQKRALAEQALQLQPDCQSAPSHGFSYYYGDNNYDAARKNSKSPGAVA